MHIIKQKQNSIVAFHQSLLCNQLLTILHNNAKSHGAYGALLVGELFMVGLFVKHNEGTTTFYLIEGDEKVSITKYSGVQLLGQYLDTKAPYYSCTAFKTKDGAGS